MTNGGIIEGCSTLRVGYSDLNLAVGCAGQQYCTDDRDWWSKRFGLMLGNQRGTSIWGDSVIKGDRKIGHPIAEKGARLRPQHFTFGSGDCSFANASEGFKGWGADEVAPPRS